MSDDLTDKSKSQVLKLLISAFVIQNKLRELRNRSKYAPIWTFRVDLGFLEGDISRQVPVDIGIQICP